MNSVYMFMYASTEYCDSKFYNYGEKVGKDLPIEAVEEFNALNICINTAKHTYSVNGHSLVAIDKTKISEHDIDVIGDMTSISLTMINTIVEYKNKYESEYMDYIKICNKYKLNVVKILVPIKY